MSEAGPVELEMSTGIVIAGAYADKIRKTVFAQLKDYIKNNKELAKEAARATAELNRLLYYVIVDELKSDKGDAVRIRAKYSVDPSSNRIEWDYQTLKVEFYKRVPDEQVSSVVSKVISERLREVREAFARRTLPAAEKPAEAGAAEAPQPPAADLSSQISGLELIGETASGGLLFKIVSPRGESLGLVSVEQSEDRVVGEALLVGAGEGYRALLKLGGNLGAYKADATPLLEAVKRASFVKIKREEAEAIIKEKMNMLT